jgi:hypothetical protein
MHAVVSVSSPTRKYRRLFTAILKPALDDCIQLDAARQTVAKGDFLRQKPGEPKPGRLGLVVPQAMKTGFSLLRRPPSPATPVFIHRSPVAFGPLVKARQGWYQG